MNQIYNNKIYWINHFNHKQVLKVFSKIILKMLKLINQLINQKSVK
jgi:hypothetical protein